MSLTPHLQIFGVAVLGFVSTSLDNLGVLVALFAARDLGPRRLAAVYFAVTWILIGLAWGAAILAEFAIEAYVGYLGVIPIGLGIRAAWLLRHPVREVSASATTTAGSIAAALLVLATSADNVLVSASLFADASRAWEPTLFAILVACSIGWCALAFWLARRSPVARSLQRAVRPVLPLLLIAVGVYILVDTETDIPHSRPEHPISFGDAAPAQSVASREQLRP